MLGAGILAGRGAPRRAAAPGAPAAAGRAVPACLPLPYQPCGSPPAPYTDGRSCLAGHADYDGIAANGCEAASTYVAGTVLDAGQPVSANLVPANAVDSFQTYVRDNLLDFCTGAFRVTLTAPPGVTLRVDVSRGQRLLASAVSRDGQAATARAGEPSCFSNNSEWLTVTVTALKGQTAENFRLSRNAGW